MSEKTEIQIKSCHNEATVAKHHMIAGRNKQSAESTPPSQIKQIFNSHQKRGIMTALIKTAGNIRCTRSNIVMNTLYTRRPFNLAPVSHCIWNGASGKVFASFQYRQ